MTCLSENIRISLFCPGCTVILLAFAQRIKTKNSRIFCQGKISGIPQNSLWCSKPPKMQILQMNGQTLSARPLYKYIKRHDIVQGYVNQKSLEIGSSHHMWCIMIMIQFLVCVTCNTIAIPLETASVIPIRVFLGYLETPQLGDSVRIRSKDYEFMLNPSVLYFSGQNRWSPANINPLHNNTNVYLIRTNLQSVKLFGHEHAYSGPYILMSVQVQEPSQLCIQLHEKTIEYSTCICSIGYTKSSSDECVPCAPGTFKESTGNVACTNCPAATYGFGGVCIPCGVQSDAPEGSTQCSCNKGSTLGADGICICDKEYSLTSQNTKVCQPCPVNSYKPFIGNTPCVSCPINQWSTADISECHCRPGFGTHAQPAVVQAFSQFCFDQYELPPATSGTVKTRSNLFTSNRNCIFKVRTESAATIQITHIARSQYVQEIIQWTQAPSYVSFVRIPAWETYNGLTTFPTGYVMVVIYVVWDQVNFPLGVNTDFSFSWKVLPSSSCNSCNANMYQNNTGLYSQCHPCPDQKSSPIGSTSRDQCS